MKNEKMKAADAERMAEMLKKIEEFEEHGLYDQDVDIDPVYDGKPKKTDLVNKKLSSKIKTAAGNLLAATYFANFKRKKQIIIKEPEGIENLNGFSGGAMVTCNHCHMADHMVAYWGLKKYFKKGNPLFKLYKIVREANFHSGGIVGFFTRNCNTVPVSENPKTLAKCMRAVEFLLKKNKKIVVFPEQALWWYYRKPRPVKSGAFMFAAKFGVPIIPCFITFKDNEKGLVGKDGHVVQEFTLHILKPIYPDKNLTVKENTENMKNENNRLWKECYETVYGKELTFPKVKI